MEIDNLVEKLRPVFPQFKFIAASQACWSPENQQVYYDAGPEKKISIWGLLHELGHGVLGHRAYDTDIDLLQKEVAAWARARAIARDFGIVIDETYAQNCLETYRNWLYKRSTCPECGAHGAQNENKQYYCLNCKARWNVSTSRFCRPYRGKAKDDKNIKSQGDNSWLFIGSTA